MEHHDIISPAVPDGGTEYGKVSTTHHRLAMYHHRTIVATRDVIETSGRLGQEFGPFFAFTGHCMGSILYLGCCTSCTWRCGWVSWSMVSRLRRLVFTFCRRDLCSWSLGAGAVGGSATAVPFVHFHVSIFPVRWLPCGFRQKAGRRGRVWASTG